MSVFQEEDKFPLTDGANSLFTATILWCSRNLSPLAVSVLATLFSPGWTFDNLSDHTLDILMLMRYFCVTNLLSFKRIYTHLPEDTGRNYQG